MNRRLLPVAVTAGAILSVSPLHAQTVTGTVTGTVLDSTGAVVPNAAVTVVNADTGVRTPTTSNGEGVYSVRFLPIGRYTVEVNAQGLPPLPRLPSSLKSRKPPGLMRAWASTPAPVST